MLKGILGLLLLVLFSAPVSADDRYFDVHAAGKRQVSKRVVKVRHVHRVAPRERVARSAPKARVSFKYRRVAWSASGGQAAPAREAPHTAVVHGGRPEGCPARAWCGCFLAKLLGLNQRHLWLARNWVNVGRPVAPQPGAIVVWRHHVGKVTAVAAGKIRVLSGNDGRQVRERWRSARGVIAYRML